MDLFAKKKPEDGQGSGGFGLSGMLTSNKQIAPPQTPGGDIAKEIAELSRKVRLSEERAMNIRKKAQMIEHNMLINHKKLLGEIRFINEEIVDIKRQFDDVRGSIRLIMHDLQSTAKKDDVQVLNRYINMWEPVNFVTRKEVERIVEEILQNKMNEKNE